MLGGNTASRAVGGVNSSSRTRFSNSNFKSTSGFLASLNPARLLRSTERAFSKVIIILYNLNILCMYFLYLMFEGVEQKCQYMC